MGLFETGSVWGWLCVEIGLNLMGLFEAGMNGKRASENQWIIFDGLLSVTSIKEWRWRQGKTGFRRSMDYLRWAFGGGKYRRMAMEAWGNGLQKIKWIIFNRHLEGARIEERRWKQGKMGFRRSMDYLRWAFVGGKYRRMTLEARENELQKKKGQSSMDYCWWKVSKNGDGIDKKWAFMPCGVCGNNPKPLRADVHGRA
ncbi:hypothetical protein [Alloprevotella tannerae]